MRIVLLTALLCVFSVGSLWAAAAANPLGDYAFTDQKARSLADFPGQTVAIWGMCKS